MKLNRIFNISKLTSEEKKQNADKTVLMPEKPALEETAFPKHIAERYHLKRSLGKGAFGIVYLAEDRKIGRLVAIKQLFKSYVKNPEIHERFMQEARIGAQLDHPNIINVFALEEDNRSACIIMEYLSGGSLETFIDKNEKIEPGMGIRIFRSIMTGLRAAHNAMAIHRDIKPPNILFDHLGEPKISDFGVAYLPTSAGGIDKYDTGKPLHIIGTPRYMSPEQISKEPIDAGTDLYSAGAVLYEMLTGDKLFHFTDDMEFSDIRDIILNSRPNISKGIIPESISIMIMKLLEKKSKNRYSNAEEVLKEIDRIILDNPELLPKNNVADMQSISSSGPLLNSPVTIFEDTVRLLLVDGVLAPSERRELDRRAERLGINSSQSRIIEEKVRSEQSLPPLKSIEEYRSAAEKFFASNEELKLLPEQKASLKEKRFSLKIKKEEANILERQAREKIKVRKRKSA